MGLKLLKENCFKKATKYIHEYWQKKKKKGPVTVGEILLARHTTQEGSPGWASWKIKTKP